MKDHEYTKLLIEQYKIMVGSTEKVTEQRSKSNTFFMSIVTALVSVSFFVGKAFEFTFISVLIIIALTILNLIIINFWNKMIESYGKLNKGKFVLIFELERKLRSNLFEREWEILTNKDNINYEPNTQTELKVVSWFKKFIYIMLLCEFIYLFYLFCKYIYFKMNFIFA